MKINRQPITAWNPNSLVVTTQFNDLRPGLARTVPERLEEELKHLSLFQEHFVIKDADFVNHLPLLDMIIHDHLGIHDIISQGILLPALRDQADDFIQVNEQAARHRAFPPRYAKAKARLPIVQKKLEDWEASVVVTPNRPTAGSFRGNLEILLVGRHLNNPDQKELERILGDIAPEEPFRFGKIYRHLQKLTVKRPKSQLLEWCRVAHALVPAQDLDVAPSFVDNDLDPLMAAELLQLTPNAVGDARSLFHRFPKRIISASGFKRLTFSQILRARNSQEGRYYFKATAQVAGASIDEKLEARMIDYIACLENYLRVMEVDAGVELTDWHKALIEDGINRQENARRACWLSVPVALSFLGHYLFEVPNAFGLGSLLAANIELLRKEHRTYHPGPLDRLKKRNVRFQEHIAGAARKSVGRP